MDRKRTFRLKAEATRHGQEENIQKEGGSL
jgi:hypothetical protein